MWEPTEKDVETMSKIASKMQELARHDHHATHVLMNPEELTGRPSNLFGLTVVLHPFVELGRVYLAILS